MKAGILLLNILHATVETMDSQNKSARLTNNTRRFNGALYITTLATVHSLALAISSFMSFCRTIPGILMSGFPSMREMIGKSHSPKIKGHAINCSSSKLTIVRTMANSLTST